MDQTASDVEEDLKNILRTRQALGDKIQLLEQRVEDTLRGTRVAAMDAIDLAKNRAADLFETTAQYLDPSVQVRRNPWVLVGGALVIGVLASYSQLRRKRSGVYPYYLPKARGADVMPSGRPAKTARGVYPFYPARRIRIARSAPISFEEAQPVHVRPTGTFEMFPHVFSLWASLAGELAKERGRLQEAVLQIGHSFFHDLIRIAGQSLIDQLSRSSSRSTVRQPFQPDRTGSS